MLSIKNKLLPRKHQLPILQFPATVIEPEKKQPLPTCTFSASFVSQ
jgi:hypothetical protein